MDGDRAHKAILFTDELAASMDAEGREPVFFWWEPTGAITRLQCIVPIPMLHECPWSHPEGQNETKRHEYEKEIVKEREAEWRGRKMRRWEWEQAECITYKYEIIKDKFN